MNGSNETRIVKTAKVGGFQVTEVSGLEIVGLGGGPQVAKMDDEGKVIGTTFGIVSGKALEVKDEEGHVIYEGLRAFWPMNAGVHLVRNANKSWVLLCLSTGKETQLKKRNLTFAGVSLLFDDRGKIHVNQENPYYKTLKK